jgi:hypothetical protein
VTPNPDVTPLEVGELGPEFTKPTEVEMGILLVVFGCLAIAGGVFGKRFHAADPVALGEFTQKSSKWSGRLIFIGVGVALIAVGIKLIVGAQ